MKIALLAATAASASAQYIDFEYFVETYECDAVDDYEFDYPCGWAYDSHNEEIDDCESVYNTENGFELCCTPDDRLETLNGCAQVDASMEAGITIPDSCSYSDAACGEITNDEVTSYYVEFQACDFSYNCAEKAMYEVAFEDTTPPVIGSDCGDWTDIVEKCTYWDESDVSAFDRCDLEVDVVGPAITYGCSVTTDAETDSSGFMVGIESAQYGSGGFAVDSVDVDVTGTYCLEYNAVDLSGNWAWRETHVVVVQDTTDCEIGFETDYNMHECCEDTDIIDYGEYSSNLPCSDEPEITNSYTFNACQTTSYQQEVSYWANDGEGNDCSGTTYFEIEDTTAPTCTAPADQQHCVCQDDGAYECLVDGVETENSCFAETYDSCVDNAAVTVSDDHLETVDECTIGTYEVTFTVVDQAGNVGTCSNFHEFDDCTPPECTPNSCGDEVEACTGEYTEMGATFFDTYDQDIQSKSTTTYFAPDGSVQNGIDEWVLGTWYVRYEAADQNGHVNSECGTEIVVQDTTPPVIAIMSDEDTVIFEASDRDTAQNNGVGATCTDTCTAITAQSVVANGGMNDGATSPDDTDLNNYISFSVSAWEYNYAGAHVSADQMALVESFTAAGGYGGEAGYTDAAGDANSWVQDEQQYYCGESLEAAEYLASAANAALPAGGAKGDDLVTYLDVLADDCAMYEVTYSCSDWVGQTATTTQYIFTMDTTPPDLYYQDCYTNPEEEDCTLYFRAYAMAAANAVPAAGVALVALVAGVAFKAGRRSTYMPL